MRNFEEIIVTYLSDDIITYPEYKGKPYFAIQYEENGEHHIGYGTYNPQVLSNYIRDYFNDRASMVEELESLKVEMDNKGWYNGHDKEQFVEIIDKYISKLKGEQE